MGIAPHLYGVCTFQIERYLDPFYRTASHKINKTPLPSRSIRGATFAEIIPVNLIRIMPAQGNAHSLCVHSNAIIIRVMKKAFVFILLSFILSLDVYSQTDSPTVIE